MLSDATKFTSHYVCNCYIGKVCIVANEYQTNPQSFIAVVGIVLYVWIRTVQNVLVYFCLVLSTYDRYLKFVVQDNDFMEDQIYFLTKWSTSYCHIKISCWRKINTTILKKCWFPTMASLLCENIFQRTNFEKIQQNEWIGCGI